MKRLLLCWIICWGNWAGSWGQVRQIGLPPINNYVKQDYQAETQNWAIAQDARGLVYFGNNQGLLEYDGTRWRCHPLPNKSILRSIAIDSSGTIYVGGQDELGYFRPNEQGKLVYHSLKHLIPEANRSFEDVWKVFITPGGVFWGSYAAVFRYYQDEIEVFLPQTRFENFFYCGGQLYVYEFKQGLEYWDQDRFHLLPAGEQFANIYPSALLPRGPDSLLLVSAGQGIFLYHQGTVQPWGEEVREYLSAQRTYCAAELSNGSLAIGTSLNGIVILNAQGKPIQVINKEMGLPNNSILSMLEDNTGNLWLGLENGISQIEIQSPFSLIDSRLGVEGCAYAALVFQDKLYLATNQGIYYQDWRKPTGPLYPKRFRRVEGAVGPTWSLVNLDGHLIAGLHGGAYEIREGQAFQLADIQGAWKFIQLKEHPHLAIGGTYDGLMLYEKNPQSQTWELVGPLKGLDESARVMEQDHEGHIWISHPYRGVYRVKLTADGRRIREVDFFNAEDGFPSNLSINVSRIQDQLLFTTERGVYVFEPAQDRFVIHRGFAEVFGTTQPIQRLLEDESGNIWFSAGEEFGMLQVKESIVEKRVDKIGFNQLQPRLVRSFEHIYASDRNRLFIGIDAGFIFYNLDKELPSKRHLPIYIREFAATGQQDSMIFHGAFSEGNQTFAQQPASQVLTFPPDMKDFRISFSAAFYQYVNQIQYQYRLSLNGKEEAWSSWTDKPEKEYTNLSPGAYAFQVKAKNTYGTESPLCTYEFRIQAPWYQTLWAKTSFALTGMALVIFIIHFNTQRIQRSADRALRAQSASHQRKEAAFIRESQQSEAEIIRLRNEKLETDVIHKNKELASYAMHLVQKNEVLNKTRRQLEKLKKQSKPETRGGIDKVLRTLHEDIHLDKDWEKFEHHFDQVHEQFLKQLREKYDQLTPKDQKLCAYLRMNLSTKEIAPLMGISVRGVEISRYRLRKKLDLSNDANLNEFMMNL